LRFLNRFTRDEVSAKVWWPFALLCVVALVASAPLANRSAEQTRDDAAYRAGLQSNASIAPLTTAGATPAELAPTLEAIAANDPSVTAVRVWDPQHTLVASSVRSDQLGSAEAMNDGDIDTAVADGTTWVVSDRLPTGDAGPVTFYAYYPIQGAAGPLVTQFEAPDATLLADVHRFWLAFRIAVAAAALLLLALAGLSMREPVAKIGTEVPFYPESVPPWLAVIDVDRAVALEQAGDRAKDRLTNLQQRLDESERMRHAAEGELQQALTALSARRGMPVPNAATLGQPAGAPRQPTPEAAAAAVAAAAASAKAAKTRRARRAEPEPVEAKPEPAKTKSKPKPVRTEPTPVVAARAEPVVIPEPVADVEPVSIPDPAMPQPPVTSPEPAPTPVPEHADAWPEVVVLPDPEPARQGAVAAGSPDSDATVLDVLNRLVEPVGDPGPAGDDVGDMRARLARTAALKKPGSRERREERERGQHEPGES
jgi:outer membrane biosynthesis protein TonB